MRNTPRHTASCLLALVFASACAAVTAQGQSRDLRIVKAVAGGVNFVSGDVKLQAPGRSGWQAITMKDDLKSGDIVKTGSDGRVEVLLNPGSYLRLGVNSEFELTDASLDKLRLKIYKGSAVVEATGYDDMLLAIAIDTPRTELKLVRRGIYRINVTPTGETEIAVQKGRALVGKEPAATVVKSGKVARVDAGGVEVAKLDKKNFDALDLWSKERAEELAKLNRRLKARETNALLANANFNRFYGRFGHGVWVYDPVSRCYTFLPFFGSWTSPYGSGYGSYYPTYPCQYGGCNSSGRWNNDPWAGNMPSSPSPKSYDPPPSSSQPSYSIPVSRGSGGGDSGGSAPAAPSRSKP